MSYRLPPISSVPSLSTTERATVLDHLFEPSVPLHTLSVSILQDRHFESYDDLVASIGVQLSDLAESTSKSDQQWLQSILSAHPRLGEKKIESLQSQGEQAHLKGGDEQEEHQLLGLNQEYEKTFAGQSTSRGQWKKSVLGADALVVQDCATCELFESRISLSTWLTSNAGYSSMAGVGPR